MENAVYFKCRNFNLGNWNDILNIQKSWPTDEVIIFNKGTENECEVKYMTYSRIDKYPIFKLIKGENKNVESGVSGYINDTLFECKDVVIIEV